MADTPRWHLDGDWFDVCKCDVPCPCEFARTPTDGECDGVLAWHVRKGAYGDVRLDGFNVVALGSFKGNLVSSVDRADAMGFKWSRSGQSSKHIPFNWNGPG